MTIKNQDLDKMEIIGKLQLVNGITSKLIDQMRNRLDREFTHTELLAVHQTAVCIANRLKTKQNRNQFVKTFNYIN